MHPAGRQATSLSRGEYLSVIGFGILGGETVKQQGNRGNEPYYGHNGQELTEGEEGRDVDAEYRQDALDEHAKIPENQGEVVGSRIYPAEQLANDTNEHQEAEEGVSIHLYLLLSTAATIIAPAPRSAPPASRT